ncbi:MAG: malto-oligosyltrehalose synthase, partial [Deinococcus sp.]|nr:malto-oligosyltrehalose synthase [Deinococcus sp.]
ALAQELLSQQKDGRIKLYVTYQALNFRKAHRELFLEGDYIPLRVWGERKEHICAFARRRGEAWVLVVAPRLLTQLVEVGQPPLGPGVWGDTTLLMPKEAPQHWRSVLTGETLQASPYSQQLALPVSSMLNHFPVALFTGN